MKDFTSLTRYIFSPGTSTNGYVDLIGIADFDITNLICIINQTKGVIIYSTGIADKRYTAVSGTKVNLFYDTSSHSSSDKLQIVYNFKTAKTSDTDLQEMVKLLSRMVKIMENQQSTDSAQRQRVTVDVIPTTTVTGTITANIAASQTLATVTTVSSVTNTAAVAGMGQEQYINIARNTFANSIRNKLTF